MKNFNQYVVNPVDDFKAREFSHCPRLQMASRAPRLLLYAILIQDVGMRLPTELCIQDDLQVEASGED